MKQKFVIKLTIFALATILFSCNEKDNSPIPFVVDVLIYDKIPNQKLSLNVILSERIEENELESVAKKIYEKYNGNDYTNVFVVYYQNGMRIGNGGYATTHFRPNLEVDIYGLSNKMIDGINQANIETKNYWIDDDWQSLATIRRINNQFELYRIGSDLSTGSFPLQIRLSKEKDTVFYEQRDSGRTYYFINSQGQIEVSDENGLIYKMFKQ